MSAALFDAINQHDVDAVLNALHRGADPNSTCPPDKTPYAMKFTPLGLAIWEGCPVDAIVALLRYGARPNDDAQDNAPIMHAVWHGGPVVVSLLLSAGADPNVRSDEGESPLRYSAGRGDVAMARTLLRFGAGRTIDDRGSWRGAGDDYLSALAIATRRLDLPMIALLMHHGADPAQGGEEGAGARDEIPESDDERTLSLVKALLGAR